MNYKKIEKKTHKKKTTNNKKKSINTKHLYWGGYFNNNVNNIELLKTNFAENTIILYNSIKSNFNKIFFELHDKLNHRDLDKDCIYYKNKLGITRKNIDKLKEYKLYYENLIKHKINIEFKNKEKYIRELKKIISKCKRMIDEVLLYYKIISKKTN